jgi:hypothetical protein
LEIEQLVDRMEDMENGRYMYLVKWKGCPAKENTWELSEKISVHIREKFDKTFDRKCAKKHAKRK